jgi:hypothetical protein
VRRLETCRVSRYRSRVWIRTRTQRKAHWVLDWLPEFTDHVCTDTEHGSCAVMAYPSRKAAAAHGFSAPRPSGMAGCANVRDWGSSLIESRSRCRVRERGASRAFRSVHRRAPARDGVPNSDVSEATIELNAPNSWKVESRSTLAWVRSIAHQARAWTLRKPASVAAIACCCQRRSSGALTRLSRRHL